MPQPKAPPARLLLHGLLAALLAVSALGCGGCGTPAECGDSGCADGGGTQTGATALLMGSITGYVGTGLVLETATDFTSPVSGSVAFAFANKLPLGAPYTITVRTQPTSPAQTCVVENASGTVSNRASNANVVCVTDVYPVTVSVTGLAGPGLLLRNNGGDDLSVPMPAGGGPTTATFAIPLRSGAAYNVTVASSPSGRPAP